MTFGKQSGPPASAKQVQYLLSLVQHAGHMGFRDARGALGLTQRQAGGKFTVGEASELIGRLTDGTALDEVATAVRSERELTTSDERLRREREAAIAGIPADVLAAELRSRGWKVQEPA